jgi:TolB-like protein
MSFIEKVRRRKVIPWLGAYLAGGFIALEGVDQLIGYELLPNVAYPIALTFYLFGIPGTLVLAWFHGAVGPQKPPRAELFLHLAGLAAAIAVSTIVVRNRQAEQAQIDLAAATGLDPRGVAVLYFEDLSPDGELAFASDGLTEALIDQLSQVRALDVISRNGVAPFREADITADSVARTLGVGNVIEGSVEPRGDRLRVTTRLVDGLSGADIDRAAFELPAGDFLAARDSAAESIARLLRQRLGEEVQLRERRAGTSSVEAWSLVQRAERLRKDAHELQEANDAEGALAALTIADSLLVMAGALDSTWVDPVVLRANTGLRRGYLIATGQRDFAAAAEVLKAGIPYADRALDLSSNDARALEARGNLNYLVWLLGVLEDSNEAELLLDSSQSDLEAAVDADPSLASAWSSLSHLYMQRADNALVILAARRAYEEDAFLDNASQILSRLFWANFDLEQFNDAQRWCDAGRQRFGDDPVFVECQLWLMLAPTREVYPDSAWALRAALVESTAESRQAWVERLGYLLVGGALRRAGLADSASRVFELGRGNEEIDPQEELVVEEAKIRSTTGDLDAAMELLKRYVALNPAHSFEVGGQLHWLWRPLRDHPEFRTVFRRE